MRFLTAGAIALASMVVSAPALADPHNGGNHGQDRGGDHHGNGRGHDRGDGYDRDNGHDNGWHGGNRGHGYTYGHDRGRHGAPRHYYYSRGYRVPHSYRGWVGYDRLPGDFRRRYANYGPRYRYIYRDDVVYVVDPTTRLIRDVVDLLRY